MNGTEAEDRQAHLRGAFLDLDQAHAAVASNGQALVVAETRDLRPGSLAGLFFFFWRTKSGGREKKKKKKKEKKKEKKNIES